MAFLTILACSIWAPAAMAQSGGADAPGPPQVRQVSCLAAASACRGRLTVVRGQEFIVRGADLEMV